MWRTVLGVEIVLDFPKVKLSTVCLQEEWFQPVKCDDLKIKSQFYSEVDLGLLQPSKWSALW